MSCMKDNMESDVTIIKDGANMKTYIIHAHICVFNSQSISFTLPRHLTPTALKEEAPENR